MGEMALCLLAAQNARATSVRCVECRPGTLVLAVGGAVGSHALLRMARSLATVLPGEMVVEVRPE